jgi:hypothetical protein
MWSDMQAWLTSTVPTEERGEDDDAQVPAGLATRPAARSGVRRWLRRLGLDRHPVFRASVLAASVGFFALVLRRRAA